MNSKKIIFGAVTLFVVIAVSFASGLKLGLNQNSQQLGLGYPDPGFDVPIRSECFMKDVNFSNFSYHAYPYEEYEIKHGDSLISLADKLLGDIGRVGEFILLNKDRYPWFESKPEVLEVGMKLRVPPMDIKVTADGADSLNRYFGQLTYISDRKLAIRNQPDVGSFFLYPDESTKVFSGDSESSFDELSTDVCVEVVVGSRGVNLPEYIRIIK